MKATKLLVIISAVVVVGLIALSAYYNTPSAVELITGTVKDVRLTTSTTVTHRHGTAAGSDAAIGAIVGGALGFPTAGAVIGASNAPSRESVSTTSVTSCRIIVSVDNKTVSFTAIGGKDAISCVLTRPGDALAVTKRTYNMKGEVRSTYYALENTLGAVFD